MARAHRTAEDVSLPTLLRRMHSRAAEEHAIARGLRPVSLRGWLYWWRYGSPWARWRRRRG